MTKKEEIKKEKKTEEKKSPKTKVKSEEKAKKVVKETGVKEEKKEVKEIKEETVKEEAPVKEEKEDKVAATKKGFISGTGRRKTSVARVFLWEKKGDFIVNGVNIKDYFNSNVDITKWEKPFHAIGVSHPEAKYSATIKVSGSGKPSQMDAIVLGISRALSKIDSDFDKILRKQSFMTRDSRMVERKKPFLHKARKRPQYSKR